MIPEEARAREENKNRKGWQRSPAGASGSASKRKIKKGKKNNTIAGQERCQPAF
jgi:hypothetical protein